jgi:hypothetical protein
MRLRALWPDRFHPVSRHGEVRNLPAYLLRDIGMDGQQPRDWKRDLF